MSGEFLQHPMMKCGHAANSIKTNRDGTQVPACVICYGIHPGADEIDPNPPNLSKRRARCSDYGKPQHHNEGPCKPPVCDCEVPSNPKALAFFEYKPNEPYDEFYCGCKSWD